MNQKYISAFFAGSFLLVSAVGSLWLSQFFGDSKVPEMQVRRLDLAVTPPPPPPPKSQQLNHQAELNVQVEGEGAVIEMAKIEMDVDIEIERPASPEIKMALNSWDMPEVDWNAFGLGDLDDKPKLLTPIKVHFPKRLKRRGIHKVVVKLDVMIDEKGDVTLIDILENPYHELDREIYRFVSGSKFTAPYKENEAVRARFIWPVEIEA